MEHIPFEYGGLHFIPERQFEPASERHSLIHVSQLRLDVELGFCKAGYAYPSKFNYSHESFYAASTDKTCGIFRCVENGRLYVPCENDLQLYKESPDQERGRGYER
mgnify:FL=1